jgi:cytochrome c peroxidase
MARLRKGLLGVGSLAGVAGLLLLGGLIFNGTVSAFSAKSDRAARPGTSLFVHGRSVFRFDTFGDQKFWGGVLQLQKAIEGAKHGGVGPGVSPKTALTVGLKVDATKIPAKVAAAIKAGKVNLNDPATTLALLKLNAVVGVKGYFDKRGDLASMGITCALCHSTVDNSFAPGIGKRRDGWPNQDLNVGAIVSLAPNLQPVASLLGVDVPTVKKVLASWGPGMFDAELFMDGKAFRPDGKSAAVRIPAAFGLAGQNLHTWEGGWGTVTYWNAFVANLEMHGQGNFFDPRLDNAKRFPIAAKNGFGHVHNARDLISGALPALQYYQLSLAAPKPPKGSFDAAAAKRGKAVFTGQGKCSSCHVLPETTEPGWNEHTPASICTDAFQADRGPDGTYRTASLLGLFAKSKRGFYHDGRYPTLMAVVNHYDSCLNLNLSAQQKSDLVQYLKSL